MGRDRDGWGGVGRDGKQEGGRKGNIFGGVGVRLCRRKRTQGRNG